ncbi:SMI1/KNR4 family protein [Flavobacterium cerinum]|uniref:SMI1/KNR4 family protein n=1 Tax=Flavobacterium cerinum TaxID=2502784 RepID=A0ABY5IQ64_9FLAO|nr:SMI1/KNR4 family protein [Flavobacterium cerinum]UUC44426.1 SMI1/KNR4 family protein [Flavobacterium cerinum]
MAFPVEEKYIIAAEDELGIEFPECFRFKMIEENGGEIVTEEDDWQLFPFFDQSDPKRISRTCNHIVLENDNVKASEHFPTEGIAIASNGCGDFLLFLPSLQDRKILGSEIFLWTHENGIIEKIAETIEELNDN